MEDHFCTILIFDNGLILRKWEYSQHWIPTHHDLFDFYERTEQFAKSNVHVPVRTKVLIFASVDKELDTLLQLLSSQVFLSVWQIIASWREYLLLLSPFGHGR